MADNGLRRHKIKAELYNDLLTENPNFNKREKQNEKVNRLLTSKYCYRQQKFPFTQIIKRGVV